MNSFHEIIKLKAAGIATIGFTINQKNKNNTSAINK
jgi:hypothetical protein